MRQDPRHVFLALDDGPPKRRFWIYRDGPTAPGDPMRGWRFVFDEEADDGEWEPGYNTWEQWFFEIMRYPPEYAARPLIWRRECDNEIVTLETMQLLYDGKTVLPDETPQAAGLQSVRPGAGKNGLVT